VAHDRDVERRVRLGDASEQCAVDDERDRGARPADDRPPMTGRQPFESVVTQRDNASPIRDRHQRQAGAQGRPDNGLSLW
jgi:hypothetical protein